MVITLKDLLYDAIFNNHSIGVDIDDVMISYDKVLVSQINKLFRNRLPRTFEVKDHIISDLPKLHIFKQAKIGYEDFTQLLYSIESEKILETIDPKPVCIDSLKILEQYSKLYSITARSNGYYKDAVTMTRNWLKYLEQTYSFKPDDIIFNHNKHESLNELSIKLFFEDNPYYALKILRSGTNLVLFNANTNVMHTYDKELIPEQSYYEKKLLIKELESYNGKTMVRVNGWEEIYDPLKKFDLRRK